MAHVCIFTRRSGTDLIKIANFCRSRVGIVSICRAAGLAVSHTFHPTVFPRYAAKLTD